ncbi:MAG: universal stress protein [Candidatus Thermoplasmatota archaeon]|nr:universal stress protein [Candidatus Thermoplasmatota archaeon]
MKIPKKILIPIDGSSPSNKAFSTGITLTKSLQSEATVLYVIDSSVRLPPPFESVEVSTVVRLMEKETKSMVKSLLKEYMTRGKEAGVDISSKLANGNVAKEIIKISSQYDLIIMGSVGQGTLTSILMGSVAEKVARYADCSVMIVR